VLENIREMSGVIRMSVIQRSAFLIFWWQTIPLNVVLMKLDGLYDSGTGTCLKLEVLVIPAFAGITTAFFSCPRPNHIEHHASSK
jgi:hypothetical protein